MIPKNRLACYISQPSAAILRVRNGRRPLPRSLPSEKSGERAWNQRRSSNRCPPKRPGLRSPIFAICSSTPRSSFMSTDPFDARPHPSRPSRRDFFSSVADGLHGAALALLLGGDLRAASVVQPKVYNLKPKQPHFPGRAKSVIQLFMTGGPSQVDLFDPKPMLEKFAGQAPSRDLASEIRAVREAGGLLPSPFKFTRH